MSRVILTSRFSWQVLPLATEHASVVRGRLLCSTSCLWAQRSHEVHDLHPPRYISDSSPSMTASNLPVIVLA